MSQKVVYIWGSISSFSGQLLAWLVTKGWHVHLAVKSPLNLFSLSPLDLNSSAEILIEQALGGHTLLRTFKERIKLVHSPETTKDVKYDAVVFCGLPPNFDEPKTARAPWAAAEIRSIAKTLKGIPIFLVSSLWGAVQKDGVVPEEFEFKRRKPTNHWESICQHYENKLLMGLAECESNWYLVRIPMIAGSTVDGRMLNFTGPYSLFHQVARPDMSHLSPAAQGASAIAHDAASKHIHTEETQRNRILKLNYNEDSTMWFLPIDTVVYMFWRFLEDENRPRIFNLVSTQTTLNREWLNYLAKAAGYEAVQYEPSDSLSLPGILRKLLRDDVQVKTRNLFEVAGRYRLQPFRLDQDYFKTIIRAAEAKNWGMPKQKPKQPEFSKRLASYYFEEFLPKKFTDDLVQEVMQSSATIGFVITGADKLGWVLKANNGKALVERLDSDSQPPQVCFRFSGATMTQLIQKQLPLHRALLLRSVEIKGPLLKALRISNVIERFLKEHPLNLAELDTLVRDAHVSNIG